MAGSVQVYKNTVGRVELSEFDVSCCNKIFRARKFRLIETPENVKEETFTTIVCPECDTRKVLIVRELKDKKISRKRIRLKGQRASEYYFETVNNRVEILDNKVEKGCKSNINWTYGANNSIKNFNDKTVGSRITNPINTIKAEFTPEKAITA